MKDWKLVAQGLGLDIPADGLRRAAAALETVEAEFRPLLSGIPVFSEPAYVSLRFPERQ